MTIEVKSRAGSRFLPGRLPSAIVLSIAGALIVVALAVSAVERFKQDIAQVQTQTRFIGAIVDEVLAGLETVIDNAISRVGPLPTSAQLSIMTLPPSITILSVIDAEGWLQATTGEAKDPVYLGDRYHFRIHRTIGASSGLFVGPPVVGRVSGSSTIQLTKAVWDDEGQLVSVYVASLAVSELERMLDDLPRPYGSELAVYGIDGVIRSASAGWEGLDNYPELPRASEWRCASLLVCTYTSVASVDQRELYVLSHYNAELATYIDGWALVVLGLQLSASIVVIREWRRRQRILHVDNMRDLWAGSRTLRYYQLGQMAAGFAHEIGTPAQTITLAVANLKGLLEKQGVLKGEVATKVERIAVAIGRIAALTDSVKAYRSREFASRSTLRRNVENAITITKPMLAIDNVDIVVDGDDTGTVVLSDDEVQTIVINLIENARKAIVESKGGIREIKVQWGREDGSAHLMISDTGCGIDDEFMERLFEPEFSPRGYGSGLGLFLVKKIVERSGGRIVIENTDRGACAHVWLPYAD